MKARLTEVFDDRGNLVKIEATDVDTGAHVFDALWDPSEEQTEQNRVTFRRWVTMMLKRKNYEPIN